MPLETFDPIIQPSPGTGLSPDISLNEVPFGDGYTLSSPSGLNHIRQKLSLKWEGLSKSEHDELRGFFERHGGYLPFLYAHPGDGKLRKWTCKSWSSTLGAPYKFNADLMENFSLSS